MENKKLTGVELIAEERKRQIEVEGWTEKHDSGYWYYELAFAAVAYAMPFEEVPLDGAKIKRIHFWPWEPQHWKPTPDDRVKELIKAGALIAAEIDRLLNSQNAEP